MVVGSINVAVGGEEAVKNLKEDLWGKGMDMRRCHCQCNVSLRSFCSRSHALHCPRWLRKRIFDFYASIYLLRRIFTF